MFYLLKEDKLQLSKHLSHYEFRCKCEYDDCTTTLVSQSTVDNYERVRADMNIKLRVTSGYRCQRHNKDVGGVDRSFHKLGVAIDLQPFDKSPKKRFNYELDRLETVCRQYFSFVKRYKTFVHCH
jgi:hypothetical protein